MEHPILYRIVFYSCFIALIFGFLTLLSAMKGAPFKSQDMEFAYEVGCQQGSRPLTQEAIINCRNLADSFQDTLDDLDKQMEKYIE